MRLPSYRWGRAVAPPEPRPAGARSSGWLVIAALPVLLSTMAVGVYSGVMPLLSRSSGGNASSGRPAPSPTISDQTAATTPTDLPSPPPAPRPPSLPRAPAPHPDSQVGLSTCGRTGVNLHGLAILSGLVYTALGVAIVALNSRSSIEPEAWLESVESSAGRRGS